MTPPLCRKCGKGLTVRSRRNGASDYILSLVGVYPYRCGRCRTRSFRVRLSRGLPAVFTLLILVTAAILSRQALRVVHSAAVRAAGGSAVSGGMHLASVHTDAATANRNANADIVRLARTGLSSRVIVKLVDRMPCAFDLRTEAVAAMKNSGVTDDVIDAMLNRCQ